MTLGRWVWLVVAAFAIAVVQLTLLNQLSIAGVHPELVWILPIAIGLTAGTTPGMAAGFVGGLVADLFVLTPFGLSALVGVLVGYVVGRLGEEGVGDLGGSAPWVAPGIAAAAGLAAPLAYALLGAVGRHHSYLSVRDFVIGALDAGCAALLVRPTMRHLGNRLVGELQRGGSLEPVRGAM